jgi:peptidoglycan/xylan/chitin deacetylase (PgdA/CDA1 family)
MSARFILSLDCEGKWGIADHLTPTAHAQLSDARLRAAYTSILDLLARYKIPATFAYVGCFSLSAAQLADRRPELEQMAKVFPHHLGPMLQDAFSGSREGWSGDWAVDMAASRSQSHEIGLHGVTHVPWDDPAMTEAHARADLGMAFDLNFPIARPGMTYIYPRGGFGYTHLLAERGFAGYRLVRSHNSRLLSLLSEFDLFSQPDTDPAPASLQPIPAGYFINWLQGGRKVVPVEVTRLRARQLLKRAAKTGQVVHYWTHPENIASAPETLKVLEVILQEVAAQRERGQCDVLTQLGYCQQRQTAAQARPVSAH